MKITEHIKQSKGKTRFTFEILPPVKGHSIQSIYENIDPLMEFNPPFIDVTYHREEVVLNEKENGLLEKKIVKKRPGTVGICAALQNKYDVDAVPHILCGGFNKEDTENLLIDLDFLGIDTSWHSEEMQLKPRLILPQKKMVTNMQVSWLIKLQI